MAKSWLPDASFLPMNQGWDGWVATPAIAPDAGGELQREANGLLSFVDADKNVQMIGLWINDIEMNFGMAGSQVQSKTRRSFFPHNFIAPVTQFSGQCPNQYEYNRLSQFIRQSQLNYTRGVSLNGGKGLRLTVIDPNTKTRISRRQRGSHGGFDAYGYILNAPAGAERWVNAPTYAFEFTVTDVQGGGFFGDVLKDDLVQRRQMESATDLFLGSKTIDFVTKKEVQTTQAFFKKKSKPQRTTKEHQGHGLPPQDNNNPFLDPKLQPISIDSPNGIIPLTGPNGGIPQDPGVNPSGG